MRSDSLISATDICIVMDSTSINVDITFENEKTDIVLYKDEDTDIYTLTLDYDFVWLEGLCSPINGIDPTPYNKDLLIALLSTVSNEPQTLFETIDLTYFSCYSLSDTEWTEVGDCYMMDGDFSADNYISYKIKK